MSSLLLGAASGATFGSALAASGVFIPSVITGQMSFSNFHMLKAFMGASACSALIVAGANRSGYAKLSHRTDSSYGWFMRYDANIVGGLLQGVAMALTGACPGTVLVQIALGVNNAWRIAAGCVLGGMAFVQLEKALKRSPPADSRGPQAHTIQQKTGLSTTTTVLIWEILCLIMITGAHLLAPSGKQWLDPILGGLLIGVAQATSVLFTRKTLGVSSAWQDVGKYIWAFINGTAGPGISNIVFATGVMAGAKVISQYIPISVEHSTPVSTPAALVGGVAMIFGARLAGGCTSGHGISGMATMSVSSFITVASMFAGGGMVAALLG